VETLGVREFQRCVDDPREIGDRDVCLLDADRRIADLWRSRMRMQSASIVTVAVHGL